MAGKKHLWILGGMVWILLLEMGMLWKIRPELSRISGDIAMSAHMTCYVVDETEKNPVFYEVNKDGKILRFFRDTSGKGRIFYITWTEEGVYYLKQENSAQKKDKYGIYRMDQKWEKVRQIGRLEVEAGSRIVEMETAGAEMYIAVLEEDATKLSLYQFNRKEEKAVEPERTQRVEAGEETSFTDGAYWEDNIYVLTDSGTMETIDGGERKEEKTGVTWLAGTRAGILFEDYPERNLCMKGSAGLKKNPGLAQAVQADAMSQKAFWTLQRTSSDRSILNFTQNKKNTAVTELSMGVINYLSMRKCAVLLTALLGAAGWMLLSGAAGILLGRPPLWIKAGLIALGIQVLSGAAAPGNGDTDQWEELALLWGKREIVRLEQEIAGFPQPEVLRQKEHLALLRTEVQQEEKIKITSMVIYAENGSGYIISAPDKAYGYDFSKLCSKKTLVAVVRAADEGQSACVTEGGSSGYTAAVIPLGDRIAADTFLVVQARHLPGTETLWQKYGVPIWILGDSILLGIACFILFHPVKKFARAVGRITEGGQEKIPVSGSRELEQAWNSVRRLLFQRERERYEAEQNIRSCSRFIPEYFLQLMGKECMDQLVPGEVKMAAGGFIQIYLGDFKDVPKAAYGAQISRLMELFQQEREEKAGVLFPEGNRLGSMRMVYENMPEAALQDAINVWKRINSTRDTGEQLNPLFLLHCGSCMCGVTGTGRQMIPFAVSKELERLEEIAEQFQKNGIRMAVTEEMRFCLKPEQECRYVGYLREDEKKYRFYEVLEVYQEEEKLRRCRMREKFEASIELFYQNDFYLARLGFSEVLKECPKDRLAVWYLFACERMFHGDPGAEQAHDLFAGETGGKG